MGTTSPNLRIEIPAVGEYRGVWAPPFAGIVDRIDDAIAGVVPISTTGGTTVLTITDNADNQARASALLVTGTLVSNAVIQAPAYDKAYVVFNDTTGDFTVSIRVGADGTPLVLPQAAVSTVRLRGSGTSAWFTSAPTTKAGTLVAEAFDEVPLDAISPAVCSAATAADLQEQIDALVEGTVPDGAVTNAKLADMSGPSVKGRSASSSGEPEDISAATAGHVLKRTGTTLGFGQTETDSIGNGTITPEKTGFSVLASAQLAPPVSPSTGDRYIVPTSASGAWSGQAGKIALWDGSSWGFLTALAGAVAFSAADLRMLYFTGTGWAELASAARGMPIGAAIPFGGATAPPLYVFAYGQALSRTTYASLFAVYGITHGPGDGSTTFNVPDCRDRTIAGKGNMGGTPANRLTNQAGGLEGDTLGATGGVETQAISIAQLPVHTPSGTVSITDPGHIHNIGTGGTAGGGSRFASGLNSSTNPSNSAVTGITASFTGAPIGSGAAHNNVQPTIIMNMIIFAGV